MARDKTVRTGTTPAADEARAANTWGRKVASDEISVLSEYSIKPFEGTEAELKAFEASIKKATRLRFWEDVVAQVHECADKLEKGGFSPFGTRKPELFSDPWYAAMALQSCDQILRFRDAHSERAMQLAFKHGLLLKEWELRASFESSIITGKKQRKALKELRDTKNRAATDAVAMRREQIAAMMKEQTRTGGALDDWLQKQLFLRFDITVSHRTIREDRRALRK